MELLDSIRQYYSNIKYSFKVVLGKKDKEIVLIIKTDEDNFKHVAGLHYLKRIAALNDKSSRILSLLLDDKKGNRLIEQIKSDPTYMNIKERIENIGVICQLLENEFSIYQWRKEYNPYSRINADYFIEALKDEKRFYIFLASKNNEFYIVDSFFPKEDVDFTINKATNMKLKPLTIIYKNRLDITNGEKVIFIDKRKN